ncbi:hypothetical protein ACMYSK_12785 [Klebsiella sp. I138]|uniref:hypothetical protein n=1 Tax=Klebsiella sp. I138 TaxID=2755385 RepID=UPI003DA96A51
MKRKGIYLLLMMASLLSFGSTMAEARVQKVANVWVLSPMAWDASRPPPGQDSSPATVNACPRSRY